MQHLTISVPEHVALALGVLPNVLADELRLAAAVKLYELRRLSAGAAAELAGIPAPVFLMKLADFGVVQIRMGAEELAEDAANA